MLFKKKKEADKIKEKIENKDFTPAELGVIAGVFAVFIILSTYPFFGRLFADTIAFVYPAYKSFLALDKKSGGNHKKRKEMLTYWVVLAFFYFFESISYAPKNTRIYYIGRSLITIWLYYPKTKGAEILYEHIIRVVLKHNQKSIDKTVRDISRNFIKE
ncbi:hypothetical protein H8356DRAFT_1678019 [Neocallimastix lanati (nom. inval.)]|uniref:Protein YOP1 n=1 Tax=Neocallimastix californiae TaxID=1754190 RepID=A0A1Y2ABR3_9FUNG|nr:hypothetical protein H8356DRAFT_1678019 [Neocallimastix sp. JGI-2020a]ORY19941.1 hypothetical protein LY90DRAFT_677040 [Neocallimastix californiae]|eukprot:ORY19941.1 hypothetical protein LY90DRAFT_677040 [Neocallimastix californiae]